jgi:hypothetical protein
MMDGDPVSRRVPCARATRAGGIRVPHLRSFGRATRTRLGAALDGARVRASRGRREEGWRRCCPAYAVTPRERAYALRTRARAALTSSDARAAPVALSFAEACREQFHAATAAAATNTALAAQNPGVRIVFDMPPTQVGGPVAVTLDCASTHFGSLLNALGECMFAVPAAPAAPQLQALATLVGHTAAAQQLRTEALQEIERRLARLERKAKRYATEAAALRSQKEEWVPSSPGFAAGGNLLAACMSAACAALPQPFSCAAAAVPELPPFEPPAPAPQPASPCAQTAEQNGSASPATAPHDAGAAAAFAPPAPRALAPASGELDAAAAMQMPEHGGARAVESKQPPDAQQHAGLDDAALSDDAMALQRSPASADADADSPPGGTRAALAAALAASRAECAQLAAQLAQQRVRADAAEAAVKEAARLHAEDQARLAELQQRESCSASVNVRNAAADSQRVIGVKRERTEAAEAACDAAATAAETPERKKLHVPQQRI